MSPEEAVSASMWEPDQRSEGQEGRGYQQPTRGGQGGLCARRLGKFCEFD